MTYSRSAWLGLIISSCGIVSYGLMKAILKFKMIPLLFGMYVLAIFLSFPQPIKTKIETIGKISFSDGYTLNERMKSAIKTDYVTNRVRFNLWNQSINIIKDHVIFGCGLNTYSKVILDYISIPYSEAYPHNSYLQRAAETGLPGLFSFLLLIFTFFIACIKYIFLYAQKHKNLVLGLVSGITAFLVQSLFDNNLYALQLVVLFWFMLGLTIAVIKLDTVSSLKDC